MNQKVFFPLLESLSEKERTRVLDQMPIQKYNDEQVIYERGEKCTDAFFIFAGKVRFCTFNAEGKMAFFWHREPGGIFGFYSAITELPQTITAISVGQSAVGRMASADFMELILGHRALSEYMLKLVTHMLRAESNRITHLVTMEAPMRVVSEILDYAASSGNSLISMPGRVELAARLGMTRETLARHLSELSKQGLIAIEKDQIRILDIKQLSELIFRE
jgi:CRP/FNR family cyclic AMP-dependent transcriptional regulator